MNFLYSKYPRYKLHVSTLPYILNNAVLDLDQLILLFARLFYLTTTTKMPDSTHNKA